jgi:hypothetical protein
MKRLIYISLILGFVACSNEETPSKYLRWVGDSTFDAEVDDPDFKLCHSESRVKQYFHLAEGLQYVGEKSALVKQIRDQYEAVKNKQSGYIRIRFIVNCNGETGRFRVIQANEQYQEQAFDESITNQLLAIVKSLDGWDTQKGKENPEDYYQYLVFKMKNGEIIEIMP